MLNFQNINEARRWLFDYLYDRDEALPDDVRQELLDMLLESSPVVVLKASVILVIDRYPDCPEQLKEYAAAAAFLLNSYGVQGIDETVVELLHAGAVV